jgi:hypothetical protein
MLVTNRFHANVRYGLEQAATVHLAFFLIGVGHVGMGQLELARGKLEIGH